MCFRLYKFLNYEIMARHLVILVMENVWCRGGRNGLFLTDQGLPRHIWSVAGYENFIMIRCSGDRGEKF